jgi:hypothetical protein
MQAHQQAATNGYAPFPAERNGSNAELTELRVAYRRQAHALDILTEAVSRLRTGVTALKATTPNCAASSTGCGVAIEPVKRPRRQRWPSWRTSAWAWISKRPPPRAPCSSAPWPIGCPLWS